VSASIGFNCVGKDCIAIHPSDMHFLWAQGKTIVIKSVEEPDNSYLKGHEGNICIIRLSKSGNLIASGDTQAAGIQSAVIVWDFKDKDMLYRVRYHIESI